MNWSPKEPPTLGPPPPNARGHNHNEAGGRLQVAGFVNLWSAEIAWHAASIVLADHRRDPWVGWDVEQNGRISSGARQVDGRGFFVRRPKLLRLWKRTTWAANTEDCQLPKTKVTRTRPEIVSNCVFAISAVAGTERPCQATRGRSGAVRSARKPWCRGYFACAIPHTVSGIRPCTRLGSNLVWWQSS